MSSIIISKKRLLKWGLLSNVIYLVLHFIFLPDGFTITNIGITLFLLLSVSIIILVSITNWNAIYKLPLGFQLLYLLLLIWGVITLIRGFSFSLQDWVTNFGNVFMGIAWLTPLTLLLGLQLENWNVFFKIILVAFVLMITASFLIPFVYVNEEWIWLLRPINFVFLITFIHYNLKNKIIAVLALLCYFIIAYDGERRLEFLLIAITFTFLLIDKLIALNLKRIIIIYIVVGFALLLFVIFTFGYETLSNIIGYLIEYQDTRTFLFNDFFADLNTTDKIFGRGSLGTYYSEFIEHTRNYTIKYLKKQWWGDEPVRITVEVGYLQMILKGGYIMFLLHISIYLYAIYVAIFKSNNKFIKRLGYYILIIAIVSLIEFRPAFTPTFLLLWFSIGTVMNKKFRQMTDSEINSILKFQ